MSLHNLGLYRMVWERQKQRLSEALASPEDVANAAVLASTDSDHFWQALFVHSLTSGQLVTETLAEAAAHCVRTRNLRALASLAALPTVRHAVGFVPSGGVSEKMGDVFSSLPRFSSS